MAQHTISYTDGDLADVLGLEPGEAVAFVSATLQALGAALPWAAAAEAPPASPSQPMASDDAAVVANSGANDITAASGDDFVVGSTGADNIDGGLGADTLLGGRQDDTLSGGAGADSLMGDEGADSLVGGSGDDLMAGGAGADMYGFGKGSGQDWIWFNPGEGDKIVLAPETIYSVRIHAGQTIIDIGGGDSIGLAGLSGYSSDWIIGDDVSRVIYD